MPRPHLSAFFDPAGVAVIGASRDPEKLGYAVVHNLIQNGYKGKIYPVNPRAGEIAGLQAYPSIADVPDPLDLVVIVLPAEYVASAVEACGKRGAPAVTVVSGGFRETGPEGAAREEALSRLAEQYQMALLGPNCIGTIDAHTPLNSTFIPLFPPQGDIAIISQSGALAAAFIDWCRRHEIGLSRVVSLGNMADITEVDILEAMEDDENTRVIALYMEGVSDGPRFVEAAGRIARQRPVIAIKAGRSEGAAKAVASHTGALAGSAAAYDAAFERAGVTRAAGMEDMLDLARALAWQPLPRGNRVAVLTNAGGLGILAVESLEANGLRLASLTDKTREYLRERVMAAASVANPVDVLAGSGPTTYALCLDALLSDETVDAVVVMTAPQDWFAPVSLAEVVGEAASSPLGRKKPVLAVIQGLDPNTTESGVLRRKRVPNYAFPERLGSTLGAMWRRRRWLDAQAEPSDGFDEARADREVAGMAIDAARVVRDLPSEAASVSEPDASWMKPDQVTTLLNAYGVPVPAIGLAPNMDHALKLAETVGYPLVAKLAAPGLVHKTDVGGVVVGIRSPEDLRAAYEEIMDRAAERMSDLAVVDGLYIQRMVKGAAEVIVGVVRDPAFGPLVMAGIGGTRVELQRDVAFALAPLTRRAAGTLLDRTGAGRLLEGWRGSAPADREALIDCMLALAQIALDHPEVSEIEVNPVIVMPEGEGAWAVDARVRLEFD